MPPRRTDNVASGACARCPHALSVHLDDGTCVVCERTGATTPCFVEHGRIVVENLRDGKTIDGEYVGRTNARRRLHGSPLANPFRIARESERDDALRRYAGWLRERVELGDEIVIAELDRLATRFRDERRLVLLCWCAPKPCHAGAIAAEVRRRAQAAPD